MSAPTTERRTVVIDGRPGYAHRLAQIERRRPPRRSVESGEPIPDARLEANPTAERTVEEQERYERGL